MSMEQRDRDLIVQLATRVESLEKTLNEHVQESRQVVADMHRHNTEIELFKASHAAQENALRQLEKQMSDEVKQLEKQVNAAREEREQLRLDTASQEQRIHSIQNRWKMIGGVGATVIGALLVHAIIQYL